MKRAIHALVVLACAFVVAAPKANAEQQCSNASLHGAYGFHGFGFQFDGRGSWTAKLTVNDNCVISNPPNSTPAIYIVNADCT